MGLAELASESGAPRAAASSVKAALDLDWDDRLARDQALVLDALTAFEGWLDVPS